MILESPLTNNQAPVNHQAPHSNRFATGARLSSKRQPQQCEVVTCDRVFQHASPASLTTTTLRRLAVALIAWLFCGGSCLVFGASLELNIAPKFSGVPIQPNSLRYETSAKETFSITRVSYLLGGFALQRVDGSWLELTNQVAWFDLERNRNATSLGNVPAGDYRGVHFHVGLDPIVNHADPAQFAADHPLNPNLNGLHWSWQGGYIFMALEGLRQERRPPSRFGGEQVEEHAGSETGARARSVPAHVDLF